MDIKPEYPKRVFYGAVFLAIGGGFLSLFYYSYLMPLHVDEGGFWLNYTNKSFRYRFIFNPLNPNHTLTIYLAKISLYIFGNNGIGLRFPVIAFAILSAGILYVFVKRVTGSRLTAMLASALLFLNPFFLHYSHELRAYPAYFFFVICSYLCFHSLLEFGDRLSTWVLLLLSFLACYIANLAAPMFYTILLSAVWILVLLAKFSPLGDRLSSFGKINLQSLLIFSTMAAAFFAFIMFYVDRAIVPNLFAVQISESNFLAVPDLFSAFLGYRYLDDPTSLLYAYPGFMWMLSLASFLYGWWCLLKNRHWTASLFLLLFVLNSLFYISLGTWIPLRSSIYLLPFMLMFQAYGLKAICERVADRFGSTAVLERVRYLLLAAVIFGYFFLFTTGKYRNFDPDSGNPFELTKTYLEENTGPNDLIISTLYDTVGGFYLGELIRGKNLNIYNNRRIENIYYIAPESGKEKGRLQMVFPVNRPLDVLPLEQFEPVMTFENRGVRPSQVHIFKRKVNISPLMDLNPQALSIPAYFGNHSSACERRIDAQGLKISCQNSQFVCANHELTLRGIGKDGFQIVLFRHLNGLGTKAVSFASMKSLADMQSGPKNQVVVPIPEVYMVNFLVNNLEDLDIFRKNVDLVDITLQKMGGGNRAMLCMTGKLFDGRSLIEGVTIFNIDF
jgi:dolichyl-phosphate-mannose-protein mannosyltransferase